AYTAAPARVDGARALPRAPARRAAAPPPPRRTPRSRASGAARAARRTPALGLARPAPPRAAPAARDRAERRRGRRVPLHNSGDGLVPGRARDGDRVRRAVRLDLRRLLDGRVRIRLAIARRRPLLDHEDRGRAERPDRPGGAHR